MSKSPIVTVEVQTDAEFGSATLEEECAVWRAALKDGTVEVRVVKNLMTSEAGSDAKVDQEVVFLDVSTPRSPAGRSEFARAGVAYEELIGGTIKPWDRKEVRQSWEREWDGFAELED